MIRIFLISIFVSFILGIGMALWYLSGPSSPGIKDSTEIVKEIQMLGRLETAKFSIETIIDAGDTQEWFFSQLLFGDKILLVAHGEIIAGLDLAQMKDTDINIQGSEATITLPPAQILVSRLDNSKTRVYDRQTGILRKGTPDLESQARQEAEKRIRAAACEEGILQKAEEHAQSQISTSLRLLGITSIHFTTTPATCISE